MAYLGNDLQVAYQSYQIVDDISGSFNGVLTTFPLQVGGVTPVPFPINPQQCLISVNGVIQEPDPSGASGFNLVGSNIEFSSAPTGGHAFFGVILAGADYVNVGVNYPSGSESAPSITFDTDLDTGIYNPADNELGLVTNSNDAIRVDSSGNVTLFANLTVNSGYLLVGTSSSASIYTVVLKGNSASTTGNAVVRMRRETSFVSPISSLGILSFENTDENAYCYIEGQADGTTTASSTPGKLVFSTTADGNSSPTERMRISSDGAFGINGANYGSTGEVLISQGSASPPTWGNVKVDVQEFLSSGTWTKPTNAKLVYVEVISAGGGGGSGRKGQASSESYGGGGGAGGMSLRKWFNATSLSSTETITVGAGGAGGAAVTASSTNGQNGTAGGTSSFGTWIIAPGGQSGPAGSMIYQIGASGSSLFVNTQSQAYMGNARGGAGGGGSSVPGKGYYNPEGPGGGGGGGGMRSDGSQISGREGGGGFVAFDNSQWNSSYGGGGAEGLGGGNSGTSGANLGDGGGGGGAGNTVSGGNGGDGAFPGGAGGGGGSTSTGTSSGAGGDGANGVVRVYTYF